MGDERMEANIAAARLAADDWDMIYPNDKDARIACVIRDARRVARFVQSLDLLNAEAHNLILEALAKAKRGQ